MKKIFSLLLTVALVASLVLTAFAASDYSITVNNVSENISIVGNTYSAYKIFDVKYNEDKTAYTYTVSDEFADFEYDGKTGDDLIAAIGELESDSDELNAFAAAAYAYAVEEGIAPAGSVEATAEEGNVIELDEAGYYLIFGQADAVPEDAEDAKITAACALTTADPEAEINVKADAPHIEKTIDDADDGKGKGTAVNVGDVIDFTLDSVVPNMTGYDYFLFEVHDTMTAGLTFDPESVVVTIGGEEITDYTLDTTTSETFVLTIADLTAYDEGDAIVITYSAVLNDAALLTDVEENTVKLVYSNNPYDTDDKGTTPDSKTYVYDFDIDVNKYDKDDETINLKGAKFVLVNADGKYYTWDAAAKKVVWVDSEDDADIIETDENGKGVFNGVDAGEYQLVEIEAPEGYNKLTSPIDVEITMTYNEDGTVKSTNATQSEAQYEVAVDVPNTSGAVLPTTGGRGTTMFYILGGLLLAGASVLLISKVAMRKEEN